MSATTKTTLVDDLTTATPPQVDGVLADLYGQAAALADTIASRYGTVHRLIGEKRTYRGRTAVWPTTSLAAGKIAQDLLAAGTLPEWEARPLQDALDGIAEAYAAKGELHALADEYEAEHARRGWARFFLVLGGHIHADMSCHTCYPTTQFGWLPALSGLTEADAVAEHGTILCSVCFPSAPVAWTVGAQSKDDPDRCPGSGQRATNLNFRFYQPRGNCPKCGAAVTPTSTGRTRKHKRPAA